MGTVAPGFAPLNTGLRTPMKDERSVDIHDR